jgi:hypothetical protein
MAQMGLDFDLTAKLVLNLTTNIASANIFFNQHLT